MLLHSRFRSTWGRSHFSSLLLPATTRKLYEKKLQKLLDGGPAQPPPPPLVTEVQLNHNGSAESDLYSDKEDGQSSGLTCRLFMMMYLQVIPRTVHALGHGGAGEPAVITGVV